MTGPCPHYTPTELIREDGSSVLLCRDCYAKLSPIIPDPEPIVLVEEVEEEEFEPIQYRALLPWPFGFLQRL